MAKLLSDAKDFIVNNIVLNSEGENQAYGWAIAGYGAFSVGMLGMFSPGTDQVIRVAYKISENLVVQGSDGDLTKRDIVEASGAIAGSMIGTAAGNALVAAGITGGASSGTAVATLGHL